MEQEDIPDFEGVSPAASVASNDPMDTDKVDDVADVEVEEEVVVSQVTEEEDLSKCDAQEFLSNKFLHV